MRLYGVVLAVAAGCGPMPGPDAGVDAGVDAGAADPLFPNGCQVRASGPTSYEGLLVAGARCDATRSGLYCADMSGNQQSWLQCALACEEHQGSRVWTPSDAGYWRAWADRDAGAWGHGYCQCQPDGDGGAWFLPCYLPDGGSL